MANRVTRGINPDALRLQRVWRILPTHGVGTGAQLSGFGEKFVWQDVLQKSESEVKAEFTRRQRLGQMAINARYVHTNLVARDWQKLAHFYETVFECLPVLPERDLSGQPLDAATGLRSAHIRGIHLRLPGGGVTGPTLEIFQYDQLDDRGIGAINTPGFAHLAFAVSDVEEARSTVLDAGGGEIGRIVAHEVTGVGTIKFAYLTDPEGNIIEVQEETG